MSNYEAKENRYNMIVGIFVVIALCTLVWLIWMFKDLPIKVSEMKSFQVTLQVASAPGVQENTPVLLGSYAIGRVTQILPPALFRDLKTHKVYYQTRIILSIDKKFDSIPADAEIKVMTRGLGSSFIEIVVDPEKMIASTLDPNENSAEFLKGGLIVQGGTGMTSEFFPEESQKKLDALSDRLAKLLDNTNAIIGNEDNKKNIKATLANFSEASAQASKSLAEFQKSMASVKIMSDDIGKVANEMHFILDKINNGPGTASRFINDGRLYESLVSSTEQLDALMEELKNLIAEYREKGIRIKL